MQTGKMRVTVTLEGVHCFTTEDSMPEEDELFIQHRIFTPGGRQERRKTVVGKLTPGMVKRPGTVLIDRATYTPGRSFVELIAWDEDGVSKETMEKYREGAAAAKNPFGGLIMLGILGLVDMLDADDYLGGHLERLYMPPYTIVNGVPTIDPMFAAGMVSTFRANRDGADYLVVFRVAYSW